MTLPGFPVSRPRRLRQSPALPGKPTLQFVYDEMLHLRERVEDLEDLRELNAAIARNGKRQLVAWDSARRLLDLGD